MKLAINLVTWNGAKFIPALFDSLKNQAFKNWELVIIDNGSTDNTLDIIKKELANFNASHRLIENNINLGFAAAHNQAFGLSEAEYFLVLNQDIVLAPDCLEKLINFLDKNLEATVVAPALYKYNSGTEIDSLGLKIWRSRRVTEITAPTPPYSPPRAGGEDTEPREVFGVSAAAAMFRRSAAGEALIEGELFDSSFFSYQEDVDLAWRLRRLGFKAFCCPLATGTHARTAAGAGESNLAAAKNKKNQPKIVRINSYKNHLMTIYKNEDGRNLTLDFLWILWYEGKKFVWFLLFDRAVLAGLKELWKNRHELKNKRAQIKRKTKISPKEIRQWWTM